MKKYIYPPPETSFCANKPCFNVNKGRFLLTSSIAAICSAISLSVNAVEVPKASPFSAVPSYLETLTTSSTTTTSGWSRTDTETTINPSKVQEYIHSVPHNRKQQYLRTVSTTSSNVKPRVILALDSSGSMTYANKKEQSNKANSGWGILLNTVQNITTKYDDKVAWNLITFLDSRQNNGAYYYGKNIANCKNTGVQLFEPIFSEWTNGKNIYTELAKMCPQGQTPTGSMYLAAVEYVAKSIKYHCQKNFVIVLADGAVNSDTGYALKNQSQYAAAIRETLTNPARPIDSSILAYKSVLKDFYDLVDNPSNEWSALPSQYMWYLSTQNAAGRYIYYSYGTYNCGAKAAYPHCALSNSPLKHASYTLDADGNKVSLGQVNLLNGMEYFSDKIYNKDLKPDNVGTDIEGSKWTGKQNIQTFTISYDTDGSLDALDLNYLRGASRVDPELANTDGTGFYSASDTASLTNAFSKIIDTIVSTSTSSTSSGGTSDASIGKTEDISDGEPETVAEGEIETIEGSTSTDTGTPENKPSETVSKLKTTSIAAPQNISTSAIDVSKYPEQKQNQITGYDGDGNPIYGAVAIDLCKSGASCGTNQVGLMNTISLNTGNWSSLLKFHQIYTLTAPIEQFELIDKDKYTCTLIETEQKPSGAINSLSGTYTTRKWGRWLCNNKDDDANKNYNTSSFATPYKVLVRNAADSAWTFASNSDTNLAQAFGFVAADGGDVEFQYGFMPWLKRELATDKAIEEQVAAKVTDGAITARLVNEYRNRITDEPAERYMGDVIDSSPIRIAGENDPAKYLLMGANDGMLYIYERNPSVTHPYSLKFTYLPYKMPREAGETLGDALPRSVARADYGENLNPHIYGVNGGMFNFTTSGFIASGADGNSRNKETIVVGTMGQGGRGAYSLFANGKNPAGGDGTVGFDTDDLTASKIGNWESRNGDSQIKLGYTISEPVIYETETSWEEKDGIKIAQSQGGLLRATAFVANGYPTNEKCVKTEGASACQTGARDNHDTAPALYIYDTAGLNFNADDVAARKATTNSGDLIRKITVPDYQANAFDIAALAQPAVVDVDFDGVADIAYAGDYNGDLYRFDFRGSPSEWKAVKIFEAERTNENGNNISGHQPITSAPDVYRYYTEHGNKYVIAFGTGSDIYEEDRKTTQPQQRLYGIIDYLDDRGTYPIKPENLAERKFYSCGSGTDGNQNRCMKPAGFPENEGKRGWRVDLSAGIAGEKSSERVVVRPEITLDAVFYTTRQYNIYAKTPPEYTTTTEPGSKYGPNYGDSKTDPLADEYQCAVASSVVGGKTVYEWKDIKVDNDGKPVEIDGKYQVIGGGECKNFGDDNWVNKDGKTADDIKENEWEKVSGSERVIGAASSGGESCLGSGTAYDQAAWIEQTKTEKYRIKHKYDRSQTTTPVTYGEDSTTTETEISEGRTAGTSYLIGLDVRTGGSLETSGVRFRENYDPTKSSEGQEMGNAGLVGIFYNSIASRPTVLGIHSALKVEDSTWSKNGVAKSGTHRDVEVGDNGGYKTNEQDNRCLSHQDYAVYIATAGDPDAAEKGNLEQQSIRVRPCQGVFMRTSLREIRGIWK